MKKKKFKVGDKVCMYLSGTVVNVTQYGDVDVDTDQDGTWGFNMDDDPVWVKYK